MVLTGERVKVEQEQIPDFFWPETGKWGMRGNIFPARLPILLVLTPTQDLHKIYIDDESYNSGHGRAYEFYGVDPMQGAVVIVRPDQCEFLYLTGLCTC